MPPRTRKPADTEPPADLLRAAGRLTADAARGAATFWRGAFDAVRAAARDDDALVTLPRVYVEHVRAEAPRYAREAAEAGLAYWSAVSALSRATGDRLVERLAGAGR